MCPQHTKCTPRQSKSQFLLGHFLLDGEDLEVGGVHLVVLDRFSGRRLKKGRRLFFEEKNAPRQTPGYAYGAMQAAVAAAVMCCSAYFNTR